ncbi:FliO/MopB family protein [Bdellovibrio svalbardensis]|uniref:Flagellar biosynthetic protein FliO n=1 Tax=Bdellovibrio svalbardensis TaxID=2972972 RepID=A0ABT6DHM0_9BACT|nr:flagellar biosynthetic protein FliO [Bdellovibrio svalbardensis]MDG0815419.1 flagellar biosynthetic protein FliO [Bdellovibrio svalbardensis]
MRWLLPLLLVVSVSASAKARTEKSAHAEEVAPVSEAVESVANEAVVANADASEATPIAVEKPKVDTRKESEIPLNLEGNKKASAEGGGFRILLTLSLLGVVGTGAFIFLRKYSVPKDRKHQTQIKVLQQHYLGPKKSLAIVRVAGESILIGVTDHNISMIKSLSLLDDEVPEEAPKSFGNVLGGFGKNNSASFDENDEVADEAPRSTKRTAKELDGDEEFAISGIKDIVSKRLKGMRSFQ